MYIILDLLDAQQGEFHQNTYIYVTGVYNEDTLFSLTYERKSKKQPPFLRYRPLQETQYLQVQEREHLVLTRRVQKFDI